MISAVLHRRPQSNPRGTSPPRAKEPRQKSANRRAFLLDCYRRHRTPSSTKSTSAHRSSVPEAVYTEADRVREVTLSKQLRK
jgi:hypothetical protein